MTDQPTTQQALTDQQLDAIEQRADAATPGPWRQDDFAEIKSPDGDTIADCWETTHASRNGAFITHARTDVPALLAEVRRLRAEVAEMSTDLALLRALKAFGVDNWDGYDEAIQSVEPA